MVSYNSPLGPLSLLSLSLLYIHFMETRKKEREIRRNKLLRVGVGGCWFRFCWEREREMTGGSLSGEWARALGLILYISRLFLFLSLYFYLVLCVRSFPSWARATSPPCCCYTRVRLECQGTPPPLSFFFSLYIYTYVYYVYNSCSARYTRARVVLRHVMVKCRHAQHFK